MSTSDEAENGQLKCCDCPNRREISPWWLRPSKAESFMLCSL